MNGRTAAQLKEQAALIEKLGLIPDPLKKKVRLGKRFQSRAHTCNHQGGKGRAGRRMGGWSKHGKGPQNVPR